MGIPFGLVCRLWLTGAHFYELVVILNPRGSLRNFCSAATAFASALVCIACENIPGSGCSLLAGSLGRPACYGLYAGNSNAPELSGTLTGAYG